MSEASIWWALGVNFFIIMCYYVKHKEGPPLWLFTISFLVCYTAFNVIVLHNTLAKILIILAE